MLPCLSCLWHVRGKGNMGNMSDAQDRKLPWVVCILYMYIYIYTMHVPSCFRQNETALLTCLTKACPGYDGYQNQKWRDGGDTSHVPRPSKYQWGWAYRRANMFEQLPSLFHTWGSRYIIRNRRNIQSGHMQRMYLNNLKHIVSLQSPGKCESRPNQIISTTEHSKGYATAFLPMNGGFSVIDVKNDRGHHPLLVGSIPTSVG